MFGFIPRVVETFDAFIQAVGSNRCDSVWIGMRQELGERIVLEGSYREPKPYVKHIIRFEGHSPKIQYDMWILSDLDDGPMNKEDIHKENVRARVQIMRYITIVKERLHYLGGNVYPDKGRWDVEDAIGLLREADRLGIDRP